MLPFYEMMAFGGLGTTGGRIYIPAGTLIANWDNVGDVGVTGAMVVLTGAGATPYVTGNIDAAAALRLRCPTTGGAIGTAQLQASFDGGNNWGASFTTSDLTSIGNDVYLGFTNTTSFNTSYTAGMYARSWLDRSGNGYHEIQTTAANQLITAYNGSIGSIGLKGYTSNMRMTQPWSALLTALANGNAVNGAWSIFAAVKQSNLTAGGRNCVFGSGASSTNFALSLEFGGLSVGDRKLRVSKRGSGDGAAVSVETGQVLPNNGNLCAFGAVCSGTSVSFYVYPSTTAVSGPTAFSSAAGSITTPIAAGTGIGVAGGSQNFQGEIYARLVAPGVAYSSGDIAAIWDSMTARWGAF